MRFMVMVKSNEKSEAGVMPDEKMLAEMGKFNEELIKSGIMLGGEGLASSSKGARVRLAAKKYSVIDGPFSEAKELVGGYWMLQAKSKAEVVESIERVPFREGEVEIRPLYELSDFPVDPAETKGGWRDKEAEARDPDTQAMKAPPRKPGTRRFMVLLKSDKVSESGALPSQQTIAAMGALMDEYAKSGAILGGEGLKPSREGARVKYDGQKRTVIDGPFTESKELIAGYTMIQTKTIEEAIEFARGWLDVHAQTGVGDGEIEIRQVHELEDFAVSPDEKKDGWRDKEREFRDKQGS